MSHLTDRKFQRLFVKYIIHITMPNPGVNTAAVLSIGGFVLLGLSAILEQVGYGAPNPVIIELGKAAFYTGIGGAYQRAEIKYREQNNNSE